MKEDEYKKSCIEMNNEEHSYKMSIPMFEEGELERFDSNIHSIVEEYSKMLFKEKDQILTQRIIMKQEEEIERLNNIIKQYDKVSFIHEMELQKRVDKAIEYMERYMPNYDFDKTNLIKVLDILKGVDKE